MSRKTTRLLMLWSKIEIMRIFSGSRPDKSARTAAAVRLVIGAVMMMALSVAALAAAVRIAPTPQYFQQVKELLSIPHGSSVAIKLGSVKAGGSEKLKLAAGFLRRELERADPSLKVEEGREVKTTGARICLWDYSADPNPGVHLSILDRETLNGKRHYGQSYVIRTPDEQSMWVVGSTDQGLLLGVMSVLQLINKTADGVELTGAYIRDYPDFQYRSAANWLLNGEGTRWSLDRGQGIEDYKRVCKRKMDDVLRFKINMIHFDGFGWGLERRFKGYGQMMRDLNQYARARGIHLVFGGYGAGYGFSYQKGPLYEEAPYFDKAFENRESYPDGKTYQCMGFPETRSGVDPSTLGTCRGNEELNRLKAEELRKFVETVEPGALYIHHEDFGGYRGTEDIWQKRCSRCRSRWPNNSLQAKNGGAGALANGYSALVRAVESVRDSATGYDAGRDCQIILVSPVYEPDSPSSDDWSNVLELWKNIALKLPQADNLQVCFREVFSQEYGGETWIKAFNSVIAAAGVNLGVYMFFLGGADNYATSRALTGAPAMDAEFFGARGIFNMSGNFFQEPQAVINAEYAWNTHSTGLTCRPGRHQELVELYHGYMFQPNRPPEVFGAGGIYELACKLLYGRQAAPIMASYFQENAWVPDGGSDYESEKVTYLPMTFNSANATPVHWRDLALDSKTWAVEISNETYAEELAGLKIDRKELHRRLARRWSVLSDLNVRGARYVEEALRANPRPSSVEDLQFLVTMHQVHRPQMNALVDFHKGMEKFFSSPPDAKEARGHFQKALAEAQRAQEVAERAFPSPIDPTGGEVGLVRAYTTRLVEAIKVMLGRV